MAYRHFLRLRRIVRLGGWKLGRLRFGGGDYPIGPLSVLAALQLVALVPGLLKCKAEEIDFGEVVNRLPPDVLGALVPMIVEGRVEPRHLRRATAEQTAAAFEAMTTVNDWPYILKALSPGEPGKGVGIELLVHGIARQCSAYTHRDLLLLPMQELLAISDAAKDLDAIARGGGPEAAPLDEEDRELFARVGFRVN